MLYSIGLALTFVSQDCKLYCTIKAVHVVWFANHIMVFLGDLNLGNLIDTVPTQMHRFHIPYLKLIIREQFLVLLFMKLKHTLKLLE